MNAQCDWDIAGIGAVAVDDLLEVASYPQENSKTRILSRSRRLGGLTGRAVMTAARLGARCAFAGILGVDADSRFIRDIFAAEGISAAAILHDADAFPARGTIIISRDHALRTVFSQLGSAGTSRLSAVPHARVLLIDHHCPLHLQDLIEAARGQGTQVVADLERDGEQTRMVESIADHLIVPIDYARQRTHEVDPRRATHALWRLQRRVVAVTDGEQGTWFSTNGEVLHLPALTVHAIETNGCGDVFHGAYAWSLLRSRDIVHSLRTAGSVAALKAGTIGLPGAESLRGMFQRAPI